MTDLPADAITAAAKALRVYYGEPDVTVRNYDRIVTLMLEAAAPALGAQAAAAERARWTEAGAKIREHAERMCESDVGHYDHVLLLLVLDES